MPSPQPTRRFLQRVIFAGRAALKKMAPLSIMANLPTVAIVGRPNVGKSALFNRLAQKRIAIVHDQPGVTRDRLTADCNLGSRPFTVVDTGGIGILEGHDFSDRAQAEADLAMELADVIVLVGDSRAGVTPVDRALSKQLRSTRKPVILAVNKIDHPKQDLADAEFTSLGFENLVSISAAHGRGIGELVEEIERHFREPIADAAEPIKAPPLKIAIVGRPNVGKSSLINAILENQRTIVSEAPGTTRDSVDILYEHDGKPYLLIDTAGIRARGKHDSSIEVFSVMRSEKSIKRADICALVVDAAEGITAQDKKIAGLIQKANKPCIIVANKLDLLKPTGRVGNVLDTMLDQIRASLFFLSYAPIDILSAHTGENLDRFFGSIEQIRKHAKRSIGTGVLNRLFQQAMETHPPPLRGNKRFKILYATQITEKFDDRVAPPTFVLFVNSPELLTDAYRRYLEGQIRERHGYYGLPLIFRFRSRQLRSRPQDRLR
jgi:GTP-binding protein